MARETRATSTTGSQRGTRESTPHGNKDKDKEVHDNLGLEARKNRDNPDKGDKDGQGSDFNPFYGMGGNQPDPLKPLTEHSDDHNGIVGRSGTTTF